MKSLVLVRLGNTWPCLHDSKFDGWVCGALVFVMLAQHAQIVANCEGGVHQFAGVEGEVQVRVGPHCPVF